jgi:hypothetical protein
MTPREEAQSEIAQIAAQHRVTFDEIVRRGNRCPRVSAARYDIAWWLKDDGWSWPEIGKLTGKHHTSIMYWAGVVRP